MRAFYVRLQPQSLRMSQFQLVLLGEASRVCGIFDAIRFPTQLESISTDHSPHVARYRDQVTEYGLVKRVQPGPSTRARTTGRSAFRAIDPPFCSYTRRAPCRSDRPRLGLRLRKDKVPVCGLPSLPTYLCRAARLTPGTYATTYIFRCQWTRTIAVVSPSYLSCFRCSAGPCVLLCVEWLPSPRPQLVQTSGVRYLWAQRLITLQRGRGWIGQGENTSMPAPAEQCSTLARPQLQPITCGPSLLLGVWNQTSESAYTDRGGETHRLDWGHAALR